MSTSLVGQKLGKYELTALLGQGGMSTVYKGYQQDVDRYVAVKVLPAHLGQDSQFVERFRLEARTIARLQHPHILPLYDYGDENGMLYLVMAYAEGGSLSDRIRRGALPMAEVQRTFRQIAEALDYAHRQNAVHRDIKPDNILLNNEGHVLLSDFGIVKIIEGAGSATLTAAGGLVGTPAYMSPEQAQGLPVDRQTDIYSLGIVVYEMLTGSQPFSAETPMQLVLKHMTAPVPSLAAFDASLPPQLDAVMARVLAKDSQERYESASAFYDDFNRAVQGEQPTAILPPVSVTRSSDTDVRPPTPTAQSQPTMIAQPAWNPLVLLGGFAIIALLIVAVVYILTTLSQQTTDTPTPVAASTPTTAQVNVVPATTAPTFGRVSYSTASSTGDTVNVQVNTLAQPGADEAYYVWLFNTESDAALKLGRLRIDALGDGQLSYTDPDGAMLPARFNAVLVIPRADDSDTPEGNILYSGSLPAPMMTALDEILIASADGINEGSLLDGALEEAGIARMHAGLAAQSTSAGSLHTHAEHTINILRGTQDDFNGNGRGENPGRGFGVPHFLDRIEMKLDAVANAPDADTAIQSQIELIRVCIVNSRRWMDQVIGLESQFFPVEDPATIQDRLAESTQFATALIEGIDLNQNGRIEPFEGECGLESIGVFGISAGNLNIFAGALPEGD